MGDISRVGKALSRMGSVATAKSVEVDQSVAGFRLGPLRLGGWSLLHLSDGRNRSATVLSSPRRVSKPGSARLQRRSAGVS